MQNKPSKHLNKEGRTKFYGWYIEYKYNKLMTFEEFLNPDQMSKFWIRMIAIKRFPHNL